MAAIAINSNFCFCQTEWNVYLPIDNINIAGDNDSMKNMRKIFITYDYDVKQCNMWYNLRESVGSQTCDIFSLLFDWSPHKERYILLETPHESDLWFQSYSNWKILKTIKTKEMHFLFWLYLTINAPDFRLIPLDHNTYVAE